MSYLDFWGKARADHGGAVPTHPAAYHCLDVAAAADALLEAQPRRLRRLSDLLNVPPAVARKLTLALVALHDIGKFSEAFQGMVEGAWPTHALGPFDPVHGACHHTQIALDLFDHGTFNVRERFAPAFDDASWDRRLMSLLAPVAGHHGKPVGGSGLDVGPIRGMRTAGRAAAAAFADDIIRIFGPFERLPPVDAEHAAALSWTVAGLTTLADWLGSNQRHFAYCTPDETLSAYWRRVRPNAARAVVDAGLATARAAPRRQINDLFPAIAVPSPVQAAAQSIALPDGSVLAIIEDVTGSGKTEAALLLAARLMADDRAGGIFFALPTMATANAMFDRLTACRERLFDEGEQPSLILAHGRRDLNAAFTNSIWQVGTDAPSQARGERSGDASASACAAWLADDRRRAFLAHMGAGTIDQAFLGVLPSKHQALRLWGLADRVLVVDEAHAFDAYMRRELERLLEFHAALGGSAIVLSATLPRGQRSALAGAFARGLGTAAPTLHSSGYPLTTLVSAGAAVEETLTTRPDRVRSLPVRVVPPGETALTHVVTMANDGAAVAWIRNSVDDAIEAAEALRAHRLTPLLLHARFAMGDRLQIEDEVRRRLGKSASLEQRRGLVVVGTQILESSLDYDVDAMVSDLAPIDLIIQRAGRLWRHDERTREGRPVATPELVVVAADWRQVIDAGWYAQVSRRGAGVYKHHGIVWRSAKALAEAASIDTPGGVRALVERVYAPAEDDAGIPAPLQHAANMADGERGAQRGIADGNLLEFAAGYGGNLALWTSDTITPTRLGDPVAVFRLGRIEGDRIVPWCVAEDGDARRSWALSEVSLSQRKAVDVPPPDAATAAMVLAAKASWPEWEQAQPLLLLDGDRERATGQVIVDKIGSVQPVVYGVRLGLRINPVSVS